MRLFFYYFLILIPCLVLNSSCTKDPEDQPTCIDGLQNGNELGVDCGGDCEDCISCSDGIQNGTETGIDCGGDCGVACPIETNCNGMTDCMQANIDGFLWEALTFENSVVSTLHISAVNISQNSNVRASVNLFFKDATTSNLPLTIPLSINDTEIRATITQIIPTTGEIREYVGTSGEFTLTTFDSVNKTATGTFDFTGTAVSPFGAVVTSTASDGKFNITW